MVGSGLAGLYSAYYSTKFGRTAVITKSGFDLSNSYWAQGGIAAAISRDDSTSAHYEDTLDAGRGLCDKRPVQILVSEGRDRVLELISMGMEFDKENDNLALGLEGGHSKRRVLHAGGASTGSRIINFFADKVKNNNQIDIFEHSLVVELITENNECFGVKIYDYKEDKVFTIYGSATIMATGGGSGIFARTTNPNVTTGDGIALAYNSGACIADMEFIQFHPTAFYANNGDTFLVSEAVRGEGAYLVNERGERFMYNYTPQGDLAPRDIVSKAIFRELQLSGNSNLYLDLQDIPKEKILHRFSNIYQEALKFGIDITKDKIPVAPAAHYMIGGIKTNTNGASNIKRLFACGEVSSTGVHGANRLASNSLLECLVFGKRAVDEASRYDSHNFRLNTLLNYHVDLNKMNLFSLSKNEISVILSEYAGILRTKEGLIEGLKKLELTEQIFNFEKCEHYSERLKDLLTLSKLIFNAALLREESRGGHLREDFPDESSDSLYHIIQTNFEETRFIPVN